MIELFTLIVLSALLGFLVSATILVRHLKDHYAFYKRRFKVTDPQFREYSIKLKRMEILSSRVVCTKCNTALELTAANSRKMMCACENVFIEGTECTLVIAAKDLSLVQDETNVVVTDLTITK